MVWSDRFWWGGRSCVVTCLCCRSNEWDELHTCKYLSLLETQFSASCLYCNYSPFSCLLGRLFPFCLLLPASWFRRSKRNKRLFLIADFLKYQLQDRCCSFLEQHWPIVNHAFIKFLRRPVLWSSRDAKVVKRLVVFLLENCRNFHCLSQRNLAWTLKKFNCLCAPVNLTLYSTRYAIVRCWVLGQKVKWA